MTARPPGFSTRCISRKTSGGGGGLRESWAEHGRCAAVLRGRWLRKKGGGRQGGQLTQGAGEVVHADGVGHHVEAAVAVGQARVLIQVLDHPPARRTGA